MIITNNNKDLKGNRYITCYSNIKTNAVISLNDKNIVVKGNPKISVRTGEKSKFGKELLFQFLIEKVEKEYISNSNYKTIEYYLPLKEGLEFLKKSIIYFEKSLEKKEVKE